jgi:hypothetical protein
MPNNNLFNSSYNSNKSLKDITGKELSTNDFTDTLKTKLDGVQDGAQVNVRADWNATSGDNEILNKPKIPTSTLGLNDATNRRYVTDANLVTISNQSGTNTGDNATNSQYSGLAASKQDTLVSGTNIKTINGNSVLGGGDLTISGGSGGSGLQGIHNLCKPLAGINYTSSVIGGVSTFPNSANILYLFPYIPAYTYTINQLSINVSASGGNPPTATSKVLIFSDNNGLPNTKILESSDFNISGIGVKTYVVSQTFTAGLTYWLGYVSNATSGTVNSNSTFISIATNTTTISYNAFSLSVTYASIPSTLTITSGNLSSLGTIPKINFRAE